MSPALLTALTLLTAAAWFDALRRCALAAHFRREAEADWARAEEMRDHAVEILHDAMDAGWRRKKPEQGS